MIFPFALRRCASMVLVLASAFGVPVATLALPSDGPELDTSRPVDASPGSSVWDQPAAPAPVIVVRPPALQPPAPARTLSPNPLWEIPLSGLTATRERPIFTQSRRPPPPVVATTPPPKAPPPPPNPPRVELPRLSLVGTIGGGEESFAIFVDQGTKSALRLKIGDDYEGWRLRAVQGRDATLERDQQTTILTLPQPGAVAPSQPAARNESVAAPNSAEIAPSLRGLRR
ncbi:hypothetical protein ACVWWO_004673 [Bradyrhizobium sp. F1.13.1]